MVLEVVLEILEVVLEAQEVVLEVLELVLEVLGTETRTYWAEKGTLPILYRPYKALHPSK